MKVLPEPLTPPDLDLRAFTYMPLEVVRLRDSDLVVISSGEEFRAAVLLWCAAWHQLPAASLPKSDAILCNLAGFGRHLDAWLAVRETALRGFIECSDGRLYHPTIAKNAIESNEKMKKKKGQTSAATKARLEAIERRHEERNVPRHEERNDGRDDKRNVPCNELHRIGEDRIEERKKDGADAPLALVPEKPDPERDYFRRVREVVGPKDGGAIGAKLLKAKSGKIPLARAAVEQASEKEKPREYLFAVINKTDEAASQRGLDPRF